MLKILDIKFFLIILKKWQKIPISLYLTVFFNEMLTQLKKGGGGDIMIGKTNPKLNFFLGY